MSVIALGSANIAKFMIIVMLMFAGIFVIAVVTPKLAAFIDKKRGKAPDYSQIPKAPVSPFESAPLPERVEESIYSKEGLKPNLADPSKVEDNFISDDNSKPEDDVISGDNPATGADTSPKKEGK